MPPVIKLDVTITFPDGEACPCGELITTQPDKRGKIIGTFQYAKPFLDHPRAFPLDPENLPLTLQANSADRPQGVHAVFEDALPDDWGRKLLARKAALARSEQTVPRLLEALGANGLGALFFKAQKQGAKSGLLRFHHLDALVESAIQYDAGYPIDDDRMLALFTHGSSPGGARPKALVQKDDGSCWIAKFPRLRDQFSVESLEAACLELARSAGLPVPDFQIYEAGERKILLVKRFDVTARGGRNHMISMQTLLNADGYYHLSYSDVFSRIAKHSSQVSRDMALMFRQMVFNTAMGNTDDHLKNFFMLHTGQGFEMSPVYDLLPDIFFNREHQLSFPYSGTLPPDRQIYEKIGKELHIPDPGKVLDQVYNAVSEWKTVFQEIGVPETDILRLEPDISRRLAKIKS